MLRAPSLAALLVLGGISLGALSLGACRRDRCETHTERRTVAAAGRTCEAACEAVRTSSTAHLLDRGASASLDVCDIEASTARCVFDVTSCDS